jgi:uncharacterized cupin superfamily protein
VQLKKTNIFAPSFDHEGSRDGYRWRGARVGRVIGGSKIGASIYELPDGERTYPYHFHHAIEEWAIVLDGAPVLRDPSGERVLRRGDVVCFPTGPEGAHQLTGPGTLMILSASVSLESTEYPDSGKVGISHPRNIFRLADSTDYWEGE